MSDFFERIQVNPIIAAVNDLSQLEAALNSPCESIFLLTGNIFNLKEIANKVQEKNKGLYINIDLIDGFSKDTWGLEYIVKNIYPDGIITSKNSLVKLSKDLGALTIQRVPILDSKSLDKAIREVIHNRPNIVEILPGIMPNIIRMIESKTMIPVIASGLILSHKDLLNSLEAGASAISTSNQKLWKNKE